MSFDMGGTTAKACLIENRVPLVTGLFEVDRRYRFKDGSGLPVTIPSIDMIEIGAGGGSIAHVDDLGLLKVGPESAGSMPGPACYGRGGINPTVTDADLMLGLIDADNFLGGDMKLDSLRPCGKLDRLAGDEIYHPSRRRAASFASSPKPMASRGARPCHRSRRRLSRPAALRLRWRRPLHACGVAALLAKRLGDRAAAIERAVGLRHPGDAGASRSGAQRSRPPQRSRLEACQPYPRRIDEGKRPRRWQKPAAPQDVRFEFGADMRYVGQQHEVPVTLEADPRSNHDISGIANRFETAYDALRRHPVPCRRRDGHLARNGARPA